MTGRDGPMRRAAVSILHDVASSEGLTVGQKVHIETTPQGTGEDKAWPPRSNGWNWPGVGLIMCWALSELGYGMA